MLSKLVDVTFVIEIVRIVRTELSYFVAISSPFLTFNIVLGMPPVPHAVQVTQLKALHLTKVDLRQWPGVELFSRKIV